MTKITNQQDEEMVVVEFAPRHQELAVQAKQTLIKALFGLENLCTATAEAYEKVRSHDQDFDEHVGLACGTILTLFGGQFATTFAFVEAFQQTGSERLVENGRLIVEQFRVAKIALLQDGDDDAPNENPEQAIQRKMDLFVNSVDPEVVHKAFSALWYGFLSASAAVKLKFANVIALGASLGDFLNKPAQKYLLPKLKKVLDEKYHRWLPSFIGYLCKVVGISIAFRLNRVLATLSTAIRGGDMLLANIASLCQKRGVQFLTRGPADEVVALGIVATGIYAQLFGPQASILIRLMLFPLTITEQLLTLWVGTS